MARQIGTRPTVAGGLTLTTAGLGYFATATAASGYPHYLIATMAMSAGIGLAMAPATASIISALPGPMIGAGCSHQQRHPQPRQRPPSSGTPPAALPCAGRMGKIPPECAPSGDAPRRHLFVPFLQEPAITTAGLRPIGPGTLRVIEELAVKRIRIDRHRARRERPWREVLPPDPRDPDVVRVKALARVARASHRHPTATEELT